MAKLFKKCPSCKYAKCWVKAEICEECRYNFITGKKPRKQKEVVYTDDDDIDLPPDPEPPKKTTKVCPECANDCWHTAPFCVKCEYNFMTRESKRDREFRERKEAGLVPEVTKETRLSLGVRPLFSEMPYEAWMDDFAGPSSDTEGLRKWAQGFLRELRHRLGGDETLYQGSVYLWASEFSRNPHIRAAEWKLYDWYYPKSGTSTWRLKTLSNGMRVLAGEFLTVAETQDFNQHMVRDLPSDKWACSTEQIEKLLGGKIRPDQLTDDPPKLPDLYQKTKVKEAKATGQTLVVPPKAKKKKVKT